jgi:endoglucanase
LGQLSFPVKVNQTGYYPTAPKYGMMAADLAHNIGLWQLIDIDSGEVVLKGVTTPSTFDEASGDNVMTADFSAWTTPGNYRLSIDGTQSAPFVIGTDIYARLKVDALRFFYLSRSGIPLEEQYAGEWARAAGHLSDGEITCWKGTDADGRTWRGKSPRKRQRGRGRVGRGALGNGMAAQDADSGGRTAGRHGVP